MQVIQLQCPNCHGELEIEDTYEICYCKYCGTKIFIGDQSDVAIKARSELQMKRDDNALERFKLEKEVEKKKLQNEKDNKDKRFVLIIFIIMFLFLFFLWANMLYT